MTKFEAEKILMSYTKKADNNIIVNDFLLETKQCFAFSCKHKGCNDKLFVYTVLKNTGDVVMAPTFYPMNKVAN